MADLPEYKNRTKIEPAPVLEASGALSGLGKAWEGIGSLGADIALNSAIQHSSLAAIDAAKADIDTNKSRTLFPAITKTTTAYNEVYQKQEYLLASNNAAKFLDQLISNSLRTPTANTYAEYEGIGLQGIEELTANLTPATRAALKPQLEAAFNAGKLKISNKVYEKGLELQDLNFKKNISEGIKSVQDLFQQGMYKEGYELSHKLEEIINDPLLAQYYDEPVLAQYRDLIKKTTKDAKTLREAYLESLQTGKLEESLYDLSKKSHTEENLREMEVKLGVYRNTQALKSAQESILINQANTKRELGYFGPVDLIDLKNKLSAETFSKFEASYAKELVKERDLHIAFSRIRDSRSDPGYLANVSNDVLNKFLKYESDRRAQILTSQGQPTPNDLFNRVQVAQNYPVNFPELNNEIESQIKFGDPKQTMEASRAAKVLQTNQPAGITKIDKDARSIANKVNNLKENTLLPDELIVEKAKNEVLNLTPEVRQERKVAAEKWMSENHGRKGSYNTNNALLREKIVEVMGGKRYFGRNTIVPEGMVQIFRNLMPDYYERTGDKEQALKELAEDVGLLYPETNVNYRNEFMKNAPENVAPSLNQGYFLQNNKLYALHKLVEENQKLQTNPQAFVMNKLEWPDDPFASKNVADMDLLTKPILNKNATIMVDGKKKEVVIKADDLTVEPSNLIPSWAFYMSEKNIEAPISDPLQWGGVGRWYLDQDLFNAQIARIPKVQLEKAIKAKAMADNMLSPELIDSDAYWILQMQKQHEKEAEIIDNE